MIELFLLKSHVAAGFLSLLFGILNLLNKKGGRLHRRLGLAYFFSMFWVFLSALLILIFFRFIFFLMAIAVFSFYMCFSGYRVLKRKKPGMATILDQSVATLTVLFGVALFITGLYFMAKSKFMLGSLSLFFGWATANTARADIKTFKATEFPDKKWWWYHHMQSMIGSMIAATTAFLVQNGSKMFPEFEYQWMFWILPALIGAPLITLWIKKYKRLHESKTSAVSDG